MWRLLCPLLASKVEALKDTISRLHVSLHSMSRRHTGREELVRELVEAT